jgi:hypothetical protein
MNNTLPYPYQPMSGAKFSYTAAFNATKQIISKTMFWG